MAEDTFMVYVGVYDGVNDAKADYQAVHDLQKKEQADRRLRRGVIEHKDNVRRVEDGEP